MDRRILVVDNDELNCRQLLKTLAQDDRRIKVAHDGTTALEWLVESNFSVVITELRMPGVSGLELIREIRNRDLPTTPIMITADTSIDAAVESMRLGAFDYLHKPVDPLRLGLVVDNALDDRRIRDEVQELRQGVQDRYAYHNLLGRSPLMREVFAQVARMGRQSCSVLIHGETGTGKELVAQAIHHGNDRRKGPLVAVNCGALPELLLESEFFGHERGSFTGADRQRQGRFEQARGGTLFLDEIGELPLGMQAKLLRVLQEGSFERVGGGSTIFTDVRVIAATHVNLSQAVAQGKFREDLYYRLNVFQIEMPALRDRREDIPLLVEHFIDRFVRRGLPAKKIARDTLARLNAYDWPGNVRELEHLVEQLLVTTPGPIIEPESLPIPLLDVNSIPFALEFDIARPLPKITEEMTARIERAYLERVLDQYRGRVDRCAQHCGLSRRSISEKLRRYGIDKAEFKPHLKRVQTSIEEMV